MLDINNQEVIAAQVAGSYAEGVSNGNTRTNLEITGTSVFQYTDITGSYFFVPAREIKGRNEVRNCDIVVSLDGTEVIGCFLR